MTITAAATGTPIQKPNAVYAFVDIQTGLLTEHGLQLLPSTGDSRGQTLADRVLLPHVGVGPARNCRHPGRPLGHRPRRRPR